MGDSSVNRTRAQSFVQPSPGDGLEGLVGWWEKVVASIARAETRDYYTHLSDMDGRRLLDQALNEAIPEERNRLADRVEAADLCLRNYLVPARECIWGATAAALFGFDPKRDWWYFLKPRNVDGSWEGL